MLRIRYNVLASTYVDLSVCKSSAPQRDRPIHENVSSYVGTCALTASSIGVGPKNGVLTQVLEFGGLGTEYRTV